MWVVHHVTPHPVTRPDNVDSGPGKLPYSPVDNDERDVPGDVTPLDSGLHGLPEREKVLVGASPVGGGLPGHGHKHPVRLVEPIQRIEIRGVERGDEPPNQILGSVMKTSHD